MPIFAHPTHMVEIEGTYIVKHNASGKYSYLSEMFSFSTDRKMHNHEAIVARLKDQGIKASDLEFEKIDYHYSSVFLEA